MKTVDWYFDFISPYAYLASQRLADLSAQVQFNCIPVVFAGLLKHWGTKGPAEVPAKRLWTFRQVAWLAQRDGIEMRIPAAHPFNPISALRLALVTGSSLDGVQQIFKVIWQQGYRPDEPEGWEKICQAVAIGDAETRVSDPAIKQQLHDNTDAAIAQQVFGVPTFVCDGELFFGYDGVDFLHAYFSDPEILNTGEIQRACNLPWGISRNS